MTFSLLLLSCSEIPPTAEGDLKQEYSSEVFICYNPESEDHNKICTPSCLESTDTGSPYCWLLEEEDCRIRPEREWQRQVCDLFD